MNNYCWRCFNEHIYIHVFPVKIGKVTPTMHCTSTRGDGGDLKTKAIKIFVSEDCCYVTLLS